MARLEYRLFDETGQFPVLYRYPEIRLQEISLRFSCDYYVKDSKVYEKTSCAIEENAAVIYVKPSPEGQAGIFPPKGSSGQAVITLEVREYREGDIQYPLLHTFHFIETMDALLHLQCDYLELDGREWMKTSTEIDEDREVYVYYAQLAP